MLIQCFLGNLKRNFSFFMKPAFIHSSLKKKITNILSVRNSAENETTSLVSFHLLFNGREKCKQALLFLTEINAK